MQIQKNKISIFVTLTYIKKIFKKIATLRDKKEMIVKEANDPSRFFFFNFFILNVGPFVNAATSILSSAPSIERASLLKWVI